jgi:hypothetical protein
MTDISRRDPVLGAATMSTASRATAAPMTQPRAFPADFLWGTAISAHQSEGNNTNSDSWLRENLKPTLYSDRSGDACDSYHRYAEDIAIAAAVKKALHHDADIRRCSSINTAGHILPTSSSGRSGGLRSGDRDWRPDGAKIP